MKIKFRTALLAIVAFISFSYIYPGFVFEDVSSLVYASLTFSFFYLFIRPFIKLLSLPLNLFTFGFFSLLVNIALIYFIAVIIPGFDIVSFDLPNVELFGINSPHLHLNVFISTLAASMLLSFFTNTMVWVFS